MDSILCKDAKLKYVIFHPFIAMQLRLLICKARLGRVVYFNFTGVLQLQLLEIFSANHLLTEERNTVWVHMELFDN